MKLGRSKVKLLVVAAVVGAVYWFGLRTDPEVARLNQAIHAKASTALQRYPYEFRVVRLVGGSAVMATPRSPDVPVYRMIGVIHPNLAGKAPNDPDFIAAEKELAKVQSEARQIVLDQPGVAGVKWELDKNWLIEHGIAIN